MSLIRKKKPVVGIVFLTVVLTIINTCFGQSAWQWRNPLPCGNAINSVAWSGTRFVATGDKGTVLTSVDGVSWVKTNSGITAHLNGVCYGDGCFLAVGYSGSIIASPDGTVWTKLVSGTSEALYSAVYAGGRYVVVGYRGIVLTSTNGILWSKIKTDTLKQLLSVAYGNNRYVAVGYGITCTSADGISWSSKPDTSMKLFSVAYGNGRFVAVGNNGLVMYSTDGSVWTPGLGTSSFLYFRGVCFGNDQFVAVIGYNYDISHSGLRIATSPDGISWAPHILDTVYQLQSLCYGNNRYIAVGQSGAILSSDDGSSWKNMRKGFCETIHSMNYGKGLFVGSSSSGQILTSPDAKNWTVTNSGALPQIMSINFCRNRFIAVGPKGTVLVSDDAKTWISEKKLDTTKHLCAVTCNDSLYVAVGVRGMVWTSPDGENWKLDSIGISQILNSVVWGNNMFVAAGGGSYFDSGRIASSPDGKKWNVITVDPGASITGLTFGDGKFVAVSYLGSVFISTDGITWTRRNSFVSYLKAVAHGDYHFVAVGNFGEITSSIDGISWTHKESGAYPNIYCTAYGNGQFVSAGDNGMVLTSTEDVVNINDKTHFTKRQRQPMTFSVQNDYIIISLPFNYNLKLLEVKLINISGRTMQSKMVRSCNGIIRIPQKEFPSGIYTVSVNDNSSRIISSSLVYIK